MGGLDTAELQAGARRNEIVCRPSERRPTVEIECNRCVQGGKSTGAGPAYLIGPGTNFAITAFIQKGGTAMASMVNFNLEVAELIAVTPCLEARARTLTRA